MMILKKLINKNVNFNFMKKTDDSLFDEIEFTKSELDSILKIEKFRKLSRLVENKKLVEITLIFKDSTLTKNMVFDEIVIRTDGIVIRGDDFVINDNEEINIYNL